MTRQSPLWGRLTTAVISQAFIGGKNHSEDDLRSRGGEAMSLLPQGCTTTSDQFQSLAQPALQEITAACRRHSQAEGFTINNRLG